ncbi:interleukin-31 receptor subunit alpha [Thunnus maccoyii]|uniref:interleukin-31 receptor subunit alpha n=1 Tax=Thunnus maccoyii TaxID=8240 RepID=UPI001C4BD57A|nr:interleukin-31 receptor subunit alpha [Thunnus maccoyii]
MEWIPAVVWTCLLRAALALVLHPALSITTSQANPRPPQLIGCVFLNRANVTCRWEAGDTAVTHYTLQVQRRPGPPRPFTCTTSGTNCTARINSSSVRFIFCITITAHGLSQDIISEPRCQSGRIEVMLPPVNLDSVKPVRGRPRCLNLTWRRDWSVFPVSDSEIKAGDLNSQIEFTAQGQLEVQVSNVTVKDYIFTVCLFRPDTSYIVRLRHRYRGPASSWSPWSNARQGRTGEGAPSEAPAFWRQVKETDKTGWRLTSLFWKPLPHSLANGEVLFYNVTCQTESAQVLNDHRSCRDLHNSCTSCSLLLPAVRSSCALTASTSAGTSAEARIWLLGVSETEPPPPSQIIVNPLDDNNLDVRWTAPVDQSVSSYVVEWFAVRDKNSSILHWESLDSSSRVLVITEGVKPMERYSVSVKALYGKRGVGQNGTHLIYTRQGAPSAGPTVQVQRIFGSTVELRWSPVPVELRHGFIRNYTLCYTTANQPTRRQFVPGHVHSYTLKNLSPGNYKIYIQANTVAGTGPAGRIASVHIGSEEISVVMGGVLPVLMTSLVLVLMACLAQNKRMKQKLCRDFPDPSNSSLAHWTPKTTLENMKQPAVPETPEIKYSEVILLDKSDLQDPDQDFSYQGICNIQAYTSHSDSPLPVSVAETPQNTQKFEKIYTGSSTTSCPSIYSGVVFSQTPPAPILCPSYLQSNYWQQSTVSVNDSKLQLEEDSELPVSIQAIGSDSPPSQTDEVKTFFLRQHQSPVSFSDFNNIFHSSVLLSHPVEVTSPQCPFSRSHFDSVPLLQPDILTLPDCRSDTPATSFSPFPQSVFVDFSYCPVECDPYISSNV